jgi:hypothetical protein
MTKGSKARTECRKFAPVAARIALSDEAAARAFTCMSENATRLLVGMLRVLASTGRTNGCFGDARAMTTLTIDEALAALAELRMRGLLQRTPRGTDRLHPLFGSIAHRLYEFGHANVAGPSGKMDEAPSNVLPLDAMGQ